MEKFVRSQNQYHFQFSIMIDVQKYRNFKQLLNHFRFEYLKLVKEELIKSSENWMLYMLINLLKILLCLPCGKILHRMETTAARWRQWHVKVSRTLLNWSSGTLRLSTCILFDHEIMLWWDGSRNVLRIFHSWMFMILLLHSNHGYCVCASVTEFIYTRWIKCAD